MSQIYTPTPLTEAGIARLSFIAPAYNEEANIQPFLTSVANALDAVSFPLHVEVVFVDDGSTDGTFREMKRTASVSDIPVSIIRFSRNFGKESAILAGIEAAHGDMFCIIDTDCQQPPAVALKMAEYLISHPECNCAAAFQENRTDTPLRNKLSSMFYRLLSHFSEMTVVANASDFRVFDQQVAQALINLPEYFRFSKGLFAWVGFEVHPFPYTPENRLNGTTTWSLSKLIRYAFDGLLSFTTKPLTISLLIGFILSTAAILYLIVVLVQTIAFSIDVPGYATIVCLLLIIGGGLFFVQGITGEYIARIYIEGKRRPHYIIREIIEDKTLDTTDQPQKKRYE